MNHAWFIRTHPSLRLFLHFPRVHFIKSNRCLRQERSHLSESLAYLCHPVPCFVNVLVPGGHIDPKSVAKLHFHALTGSPRSVNECSLAASREVAGHSCVAQDIGLELCGLGIDQGPYKSCHDLSAPILPGLFHLESRLL